MFLQSYLTSLTRMLDNLTVLTNFVFYTQTHIHIYIHYILQAKSCGFTRVVRLVDNLIALFTASAIPRSFIAYNIPITSCLDLQIYLLNIIPKYNIL